MMPGALVLVLIIPLGLDLYLPAPEGNPITTDKIESGRRLFSDRRLSRDGTVACDTCHDPAHAFSDGQTIAVGIGGRVGRRNVPTLINRAYGRTFSWDGREGALETQVLKPIEDPSQMDFSVEEAAARVGLTRGELAKALSTFVRSLLSGNSRFDRYVFGDITALSQAEQEGLRLFRGKANCVACHLGPTLTDERFRNTGVAWRPEPGHVAGRPVGTLLDLGRFEVTGRNADRGAFKTPTLRDAELTSPYMHDGSLATIEDVVAFYDQGGRPNPYLDPDVKPLKLTDDERRALAAFLRSLTGQPTR